MADADEDAIPSQPSQIGEEHDLEDEAQDFRFLTSLTASGNSDPTIPKRGTKDFEPNPTRSQASALDASRHAMQSALSVVRIHTPKNHVVGQFVMEDSGWWGAKDDRGRTDRCVWVYRSKTTHAKVMGREDGTQRLWLLPEEALYLLERGTLDVRWPDAEGVAVETAMEETQGLDVAEGGGARREVSSIDHQAKQEPQVGELPMSLQGAYASFIGKSGLTLERYQIYASLKRSGYIIQRAPTWSDEEGSSNGHAEPTATTSTALVPVLSQSTRTVSTATRLINRLVSWLFTPQRSQSQGYPSFGPLVAPGLYRNYNDIFRALALIPYHETTEFTPSLPPRPPQPKAPFSIAYHIWKPTPNYRKSAPPPPDFHVAVVDARMSSVPTMEEIGTLLDSMPLDEAPASQRMENKIKHGKRSVILGVVDSGVTSYLRFSEASIGSFKLFELKRGGGQKKGGQRQGKPKGAK